MSQMPAGWYADPMSSGTSVVRYWDGTRWTQHVQAAPDPAAAGADPAEPADAGAPGATPPGSAPSAPPAVPPPSPYPYGTHPPAGPQAGPYAGYPSGPYGADPSSPRAYPSQPGGAYGPYGQQPPGYPGGPYGAAPMAPWADPRATTPDGQPLAGWWVRFAAWVLDGLIVGLISLVVAFPWVRTIFSAYADFVAEAIDAAEQGRPAPDATAFVVDLAPELLAVTLISLGLTLVYHALFLRWRGATPGKMALGLRVRLRDAPGQLSWSTIGLRLLGQHGPSLLSVIPVLGTIASFYPAVDGLWPLWDGKRQALHDKIAKTNVVKVR